MIRSVTIAASLAGLLLLPLAAVAQQDELDHFAGVVLAVDPAKGILTVEQASEDAPEKNFMVMDDTELTKDGGAISLGDIVVGDPVSVEYEMTSSGNRAHSVEVITKPTT